MAIVYLAGLRTSVGSALKTEPEMVFMFMCLRRFLLLNLSSLKLNRNVFPAGNTIWQDILDLKKFCEVPRFFLYFRIRR